MPTTCCCVPHCHQRGGHVFPANEEMRQKWIKAIKRLDESTLKDWQPSATALVCKAHFRSDDFPNTTISGAFLEIFCQFALSWTKNSNQEDIFNK